MNDAFYLYLKMIESVGSEETWRSEHQSFPYLSMRFPAYETMAL
jgi:hypothetical protein